MKTSKEGLEMIMKAEGWVPTVYLCQAGHPTIGYGHLITPEERKAGTFEGRTLTEAEGLALLQQDVRRFEVGIGKLVKVKLSQNQFDALVDFAFNLGLEALKNSTLLRRLNDGDYNLAGEFSKWCRARNPKTGRLEVLSGLVRRRKREADLFSLC